LDPSQFQTPDPLANLSIRAMNSREDFIADFVFPPVPVQQRQYRRYQYDLNNKRERPLAVKVGTKTKANMVDYNVTNATGEVSVRRLAAEWDPQDAKDFDKSVSDLQTDAALTLTEQLWIAREREVINKINAVGNFATGLSTTLTAGTTRWGDGSTANPVGDVIAARAAVRSACGVNPDSIAMSWTMFEKLKALASIIDRVKYTQPGAAPDINIFKGLFGVQNIFICGGVSTTANEGAATQALSDMWGNYVLVFKQGQVGLRQMGFGYNFTLQEGMYSKAWQDPQKGAQLPMQGLEMGWWYDLQPGFVDSFASGKFNAGYLIANTY
jgi:hypothetical protein